MAPNRISSSLTLVLRILLPILWTSFFGAMAIAVLLKGEEMGGMFYEESRRYIFVACFIVCLVIIWYLATRIYRVEVDDSFVYVYNYLKHARYPYHNVGQVSPTSMVFLGLYRVKFNAPGIFGKSIYFLASPKKLARARSLFPSFEEKFS